MHCDIIWGSIYSSAWVLTLLFKISNLNAMNLLQLDFLLFLCILSVVKSWATSWIGFSWFKYTFDEMTRWIGNWLCVIVMAMKRVHLCVTVIFSSIKIILTYFCVVLPSNKPIFQPWSNFGIWTLDKKFTWDILKHPNLQLVKLFLVQFHQITNSESDKWRFPGKSAERTHLREKAHIFLRQSGVKTRSHLSNERRTRG